MTPGFGPVLIWFSTPTLSLRENDSPVISQSERDILITIAEEFRQDVSEPWLERVLSVALDFALEPGEPGQISLLLTDDETVRELNRHFRGLDETTDVLSFSLIHQGHWEGEDGPYIGPDEVWPDFMLPPNELPPLGEVIISYPQTCRQALAMERPVERELALLAVHGALHLVGHDHLEPEETTRMQALEQAALDQIFADREEPS